MHDSRFVDALLRHFGDGSEHLCVLASPDAVQAMVVLQPGSSGYGGTFLPSQAQLGPQLVPDIERLEGLHRALPKLCLRIELLSVDPDLTRSQYRPKGLARCLPHALTISIDLAPGFEQYWASRPKKLRDNLRRYAARVAAADPQAEFRLICDSAALPKALMRYGELESRGWKGAEGTAIRGDNTQGVFYLDILSAFASKGGALVWELWIHGRLAASRMAIASDNTLSMLKTTYDEGLANLAPGRLLLRHAIEQSYALHPGKRIEFCTDADADLLAWATSHRHIEHWSFFRGPLPQALYDLGRMLQNIGRSGASASNGNPPTVDIHHSVDHLPADALELLRTQELDSLQLGADWLRNLERTVFPGHDGVRYFVLRDKGGVLLVMPTMAEPSRLGTRVRSLSNFYTALYSPAMQPWVKPQTFVPLLRSIFKHHTPVRSLRLDPMDPDGVAYKTLSEALRIAGTGTFAYFCFGNWALSPAGGWKAYLATRSANLRSSVKRMTNRLVSAGGRLEVITQIADLERGLAAYHRVYSSSWKVPEPFGDFMPNLFRLCAARGAMRLGIAWLHDVPIAAQIWIVHNGRAEIFKVAYDEAYKQYSPGTVVTALLMEHVLELDRVTEVDYLIGDDTYKAQWMSHRRERWGLVAYNRVPSRVWSGSQGRRRDERSSE